MKKTVKIIAKKACLLALCAAFTALASCSNAGDSGSSGNTGNSGTQPGPNQTNNTGLAALKYLSIAKAKNLYISSSASTARSAETDSGKKRIFKITEEGYTEEVKYLDENNNEITITNEPAALYTVNEQYIYVGFGSQYSGSSIQSSYLVRKNDGAVFDMTKAGNPSGPSSDFKNAKIFKNDKKNNSYFVVYEFSNNLSIKKIVKINLDGIESLEASTISASTDYVNAFDVDWNGNVIYNAYLISNPSNEICRIKKANGGLANLSKTSAYWIGLDGNIFSYSNYDQNDYKEPEYNSVTSTTTYYDYPIKKINVDTNYNVSNEIYGYFTNINNQNVNLYQSSSYKIEAKDRIIIIYASSNLSGIYEAYNPSGKPRIVSLANCALKSITAVESTENFYYIAGTDSNNNTLLIKVDPTTDAWTNLLPQNDYDVYAFTASETDGIVFNALRMSDGKKVIGKVAIDGGQVTIIDQESNAQVTCLERIN